MARFHDLIDQIRYPGEDGIPETVYDDLAGEYDSVLSGATARDDEHAGAIQALQAEISALKAQNFDLLMAQTASAKPDDVESDEPNDSDDDEPEDEGIESLFG